MRYNRPEYQKAHQDSVRRKARGEYVRSLIDTAVDATRTTILNYSPVVGWLPNRFQEHLRDNKKKTFGKLDPETSSLSAATATTILAGAIGIDLNGFDIGSVSTIKEGWIEVVRYRSYIGQFIDPIMPYANLERGFPREVTEAASYVLLGDGAIRLTSNIAFNKPLGFVPLELISYAIDRGTASSSVNAEIEGQLTIESNAASRADEFIGRDRKAIESQIASEEARALKEGRDPEGIDELIAKLGVENA